MRFVTQRRTLGTFISEIVGAGLQIEALVETPLNSRWRITRRQIRPGGIRSRARLIPTPLLSRREGPLELSSRTTIVGETILRADHMPQNVVHLIGPGGAGKTTTGAKLAQRLGIPFVDLDERFAATRGNISEYLGAHGYAVYASQNVQAYLEVVGAQFGPAVLALSSGFMTYPIDVHCCYERVRREIAVSATTLVLLPSLDYETCVSETVRRQLARPFSRSAAREEQVIRERFDVYRSLSAAKLETMNALSEVVDAAVANLLPNIRLQPGPWSARAAPRTRS